MTEQDMNNYLKVCRERDELKLLVESYRVIVLEILNYFDKQSGVQYRLRTSDAFEKARELLKGSE